MFGQSYVSLYGVPTPYGGQFQYRAICPPAIAPQPAYARLFVAQPPHVHDMAGHCALYGGSWFQLDVSNVFPSW